MIRRKSRSPFSFMIFLVISFQTAVIFFIYSNTQEDASSPGANNTIIQDNLPQSLMPALSIHAPPTITQDAAISIIDESYLPVEGATLFIPSIAVQTSIIRVFLDGTSWDVGGLGMNVGHLQGTNWITDGGNTVISGHVEMRDGGGGIFADLDILTPGNLVLVKQGEEELMYTVTKTFNTSPNDLEPLYPTSKDRLTLITCDDYNFFSNSYKTRTIVIAERTS